MGEIQEHCIAIRQKPGPEGPPLVMPYMIMLLQNIHKQCRYQDVILGWAYGYVGWVTEFNMNV